MKYLLVITQFISVSVFAQNSQRDELNPNQLEIKEFKLDAQKIAPDSLKLPFKSIKIIDSRFDTSKIGYILATNIFSDKKSSFKQMVLQGGNGNAIEKYYNKYYAGSFTGNDFELLIVMKRFWLGADSKRNNKRVEVTNSVESNNTIYCKWEYYLGKNGKYLPVKRVDTVIQNSIELSKYIQEEFSEKKLSFFKYALRGLIEILDYSNAIKQFDSVPKKTWIAVNEFNQKMNLMPALLGNTFKKGVYLSFDDFRKNRPSIIDFQEKKMHYGKMNANTEIYLEDMTGTIISNYWGYSDGTVFRYGMLGNDKIYRIQNTFCFFIKVLGYVISSDTQAGSGMVTTSKNKYEIWVPFQIDMETGEIY